jgi:hypothetical protein
VPTRTDAPRYSTPLGGSSPSAATTRYGSPTSWLQYWAESAIRPELRPVHSEFYARWRETVVRIVRRGLRQGVFRDVDADQVALRLTALTDGLAIQVLTGSPAVSVTVMRELLVDFARRELLVGAVA